MGSAASVVDSHPLLPTPVIPSSAVRLEPVVSWLAGWLGRGKKGRRRRGGEKTGTATPRQGDASPARDGGRRTAERRHGSAYLHPHPPACTAGAADGDDSTRLLL